MSSWRMKLKSLVGPHSSGNGDDHDGGIGCGTRGELAVKKHPCQGLDGILVEYKNNVLGF